MINHVKKIDIFHRNIILVFFGTSLVNLLNLFYQFLIAHQFSPADFAAFNSLLAILGLLASPLGIIQAPLVKRISELKAQGQSKEISGLLSILLRKVLALFILTCLIFYFLSPYILNKLKINAYSSGHVLTILLALCWIMPLCFGGLQGLELFKWLVFVSIAGGTIKLISAFIFTRMGFNITGALSALLLSTVFMIIFSYLPLKRFISLKKTKNPPSLKGIFSYMIPVGISSFCYSGLVGFDMVLVKYFFIPTEAGFYSLAQMIGKVFLFLPGAISLVMFPRICGLSAQNMDTVSTLRRSLLYAAILSILAVLFYNVFPIFSLKLLTGKAFPESILLGRLFGISMTLFALLNVFINYFLSLGDLRFIKYLAGAMLLQVLGIFLFHRSLIQIQAILCIVGILLFFVNVKLVYTKK